MPHIHSSDPRKKEIVAAFKSQFGGTKVTMLREDKTHYFADVLRSNGRGAFAVVSKNASIPKSAFQTVEMPKRAPVSRKMSDLERLFLATSQLNDAVAAYRENPSSDNYTAMTDFHLNAINVVFDLKPKTRFA